MRRSKALFWVVSTLVTVCASISEAAAPLRPDQPYAEATLCATPDVIFCEDFNYPQNITWTGVVEHNDST